MAVDALSALVRGLSFIALFQAAGIAIFIALFRGRLQTTSTRVRRLALWSAVSGIVLVTVHYGVEAARMAGAMSGVLDPELQQLVFDSPMGIAWICRTTALAAIAVTIGHEHAVTLAISLIGVVAAIAAFLFVGHSATHPDRVAIALLLALHLGVVAFWFGSLLPLHAITERETPSVAAEIVNDFSRTAGWLVPAILLAGVAMVVLLVDRWATFREGYGVLLLAKVVAFSALMGLAAANKWRFGPAISRSREAAFAFQRSVLIEYVLICAVLFVTAVMTTFFSPES